MATIPVQEPVLTVADYPDSDGQPMGETPLHIDNLAYLVLMLRAWYERDPRVYIAGNMFVYYVPNNRNRHVSPDVFVVFDIPKSTTTERRRYLVWAEGKAPDVVIELTSESTREQDIDNKKLLYRNLGVREYFLFDPYEEYLDPPLQGHRLLEGEYQPIPAVAGRLPSLLLGLHLETSEGFLRLYDPATQSWLPTPPEEHQALLQSEAARQQAEAARQQAEARHAQEEEARRRAEAEVEQLRQEIERLRGQLPPP